MLFSKGRGVKGIAFAGALSAVEEYRYSNFQNVAGTSTGAGQASTGAFQVGAERGSAVLCELGIRTASSAVSLAEKRMTSLQTIS